MSPTMITLILNILLAVFLLVGILFGIKRGVKKAGVRILLFAISILVSMLVAPLISNLILQVKLNISGEVLTINDYIVKQLMSSPEIQKILESTTVLEEIIQKAPIMIMNLIVFELCIYIIGFICYLVYTVVSNVLFKKNKIKNPEYTLKNKKPVLIENNQKQKKYRILGGLVGGLQGLVLMFFTFVPIGGFVSTFNEMMKEPVVAEEFVEGNLDPNTMPESIQDLLKQQLPKEVFDYIDAYNKSIYAKVDNALPFTDLYFDTLSSVKVDGEKIVFRKELLNAGKIYNNVSFLMNIDLSGSLKDFDFAKLKTAVNLLFDIKTFKLIAPELLTAVLNEYQVDNTVQYAEEINQLIKDMAEYLKAEQKELANTLKTDVLSLLNIAEISARSGLIDEIRKPEINIDAINKIIKGEDGKYLTPKGIIDNIFASNTIKAMLANSTNMLLALGETQLKTIMPEHVDKETVFLGRIDNSKVNWDNTTDSFFQMFQSAYESFTLIGNVDLNNPNQYEILENIDYETLLNNFGSVLDKIKEMPIFSATKDNSNVYNNIMKQFNKTQYGRYFDFTKSSTRGFWNSNVGAIVKLLDFEQSLYTIQKTLPEKPEQIENYQMYLDKIDFNLFKKAIDELSNCSILNIIRDDAVANFKEDYIKEENIPSTFSSQLAKELIINLANEGNIVNELQKALNSTYNIFKSIVNSKLVDEFIHNNINVPSILNKLKVKDESGKTFLDILTENLFTTTSLKSCFIGSINFGLEELEKTFVLNGLVPECNLGRINYNNTNWNKTESEIKNIFNELLNFKTIEQPIVIQGKEIFIDLPSSAVAFGNALQKLRDFNIFNISPSNNIFDNVINIYKNDANISKYLDLSVLLDNGAITQEFKLVSDMLYVVVNSKILDTLNTTGMTLNTLRDIAGDMNIKIAGHDGQPITKTAYLLNAMFDSKLANKMINVLFENVDKMLQDNVVNISNMVNGEGGALVEVSHLNIEALKNADENAKIISTIENLFEYLSGLQIGEDNKLDLVDILNSKLGDLGLFLNSTKNLSLFKSSNINEKGLYVNIVDWCDGFFNNSFPGYVDFTIAKNNDFNWNDEFNILQPSLQALVNIKVDVLEGAETVKKSLYEVIGDIDNILKINPDVALGKEHSEVYELLNGFLSSNLFKKIGGVLIDHVNEIIKTQFDVITPIDKFTNYESIKNQKDEIIKIAEQFIRAKKSNVFDKLNAIDTITDSEVMIVGELLNLFKNNAYRTLNTEVTEQGVFKVAYDNLVDNVFTKNSAILKDLVDVEVTKTLTFDWKEELKNICSSLKAMKSIQIEVSKGTYKPLFECLDNLENILKINPNIVSGKQHSEVYDVLNGLLSSDIFRKTNAQFIDKVNDIFVNTFTLNPIAKFNEYEKIKNQKVEIIKIIEEFIKSKNSGAFDKLQNNEKLTQEEITLVGNALNSFKDNANRTKVPGITEEGVFKPVYSSIEKKYEKLLKNDNGEFINVNWVDIISIIVNLNNATGNKSEAINNVKPFVENIFVEKYGKEKATELTGKVDNIVNSLQNVESGNTDTQIKAVDTLLNDVATTKEIIDVIESTDMTIPIVEIVNKPEITPENLTTKIDNLNIQGSPEEVANIKNSLKNIFGVNKVGI